MKPNALHAKPATPGYLRELVESSGLSQRESARRLGVNERTMRFWLVGKFPIPYTAQYCLEVLAEGEKP